MRGKIQGLTDSANGTCDASTSPSRKLGSIRALDVTRLLPDQIVQLFSQRGLGALGTAELTADIEAPLYWPSEARVTMLRVGPLELDLIERAARRGERMISLRQREFRLLEYMMRRRDQILTRAKLLQEVWNYKFVPKTNLVDVHMGRLRRKVDASNDPPMISNVRGVGFILRMPFG